MDEPNVQVQTVPERTGTPEGKTPERKVSDGKISESPLKRRRRPTSKKRQARKDKKKKREKLKENDAVQSENCSWKVIKLLGSGGFGDVYRVYKEGVRDKEYAMKTEMVEGDVRMLRLKIEVTVLKQCWEAPDPETKKHFVDFVDRGITDKFKFIVMGLVGPSLEDIRKAYLMKNYSKPTAMNIAIQTLRSIANLHNIGWLHRDIKPQNFAVGLGDKESTIYMLDFGIARNVFKPDTREVKVPREKVKFLGTLRYACRACHYGQEQGRKDDVETWIFMTYDLFDDENGIPWKRATDKNEFLQLKERFCAHEVPKPSKIVPKEFKTIIDYVCTLSYPDEVNYKYIETILNNTAKENGIKMDKKLDWIGKLKKKKLVTGQDDSGDTSSDNRQSGSDSSDSDMPAARRKGSKVPSKPILAKRRPSKR